jgi:DNA replication protein DnaC
MTTSLKTKKICPFCNKPVEKNIYGFTDNLHTECREKVRKLKTIGLDKLFWKLPEFKIENGNKTAFEAVENFIKNPDIGLFLFGQAGVGKTHLVSKLAQETNKDIKFIKVPKLLFILKSNFDGHSYRNKEILDELIRVSVLILDDLGAEKATEWVRETLYILIDERYGNMKKTIITSNYNPSYLTQRLGDRIVSRISEMCRIIEIKTSDKRKNRRKNV